jgi:hypothetical protein
VVTSGRSGDGLRTGFMMAAGKRYAGTGTSSVALPSGTMLGARPHSGPPAPDDIHNSCRVGRNRISLTSTSSG